MKDVIFEDYAAEKTKARLLAEILILTEDTDKSQLALDLFHTPLTTEFEVKVGLKLKLAVSAFRITECRSGWRASCQKFKQEESNYSMLKE